MRCPFCNKSFDLNPRSIPENKYYWSVIIGILSEELGYSSNEMHEILKAMFLTLKRYIKNKKGIVREVTTIRSTTELTTIDFEKYLSDIRIWASAEMNVFLPMPNEEIIP